MYSQKRSHRHILGKEILFIFINLTQFVLASSSTSGFGLGLPFYAATRQFFKDLMRGIISVGIIACCILPIPFVRKFEGYLLTFAGTYITLNHILAPLLTLSIFDWFTYIFGVVLILLSGGSAFLSMNEKFRDLFLSIGGGYVSSAILFTFFGFENLILYLATFLIFSIGLIVLKKPLKNTHYALCKAAILSFILLIALDTIPLFRIMRGIFGDYSNWFHTMNGYLGYAVFAAGFAFIFVISFFKGLIPGF